MASLTITVDEELLQQARIRALKQGTSVNALFREWLERYTEPDRSQRVTQEFIAIAKRSQASSGPGGRTWTRDEIYEERLDRYGR